MLALVIQGTGGLIENRQSRLFVQRPDYVGKVHRRHGLEGHYGLQGVRNIGHQESSAPVSADSALLIRDSSADRPIPSAIPDNSSATNIRVEWSG